jgi:hypothetical protein
MNVKTNKICKIVENAFGKRARLIASNLSAVIVLVFLTF